MPVFLDQITKSIVAEIYLEFRYHGQVKLK